MVSTASGSLSDTDQGAKRPRLPDVERYYYGECTLLEKEIPVVHLARRKLHGAVGVHCKEGPTWEDREVRCTQSTAGRRSVLCSRDSVDQGDPPTDKPEDEVTVPLGFLRRLAWSSGDPKKA